MKFYYGLWNNFYELKWPIRFFWEILFLFLAIMIFIKILKKLIGVLYLREKLIKVWVWIVSEIVYLFGHNKEWTIKMDEKINEWGNTKINKNSKKNFFVSFCIVFLGILLYIGGIISDLPVFQQIGATYQVDLITFKDNVQTLERFLSKGYENYPPLFINRKKEEVNDEINVSEEIIYLRLNQEGKNGTNIRQEPSLDGVVVGGISGEVELVYQNQYEYDGERYWVKVFYEDENIYGWVSGKLIEQEQLEKILQFKE